MDGQSPGRERAFWSIALAIVLISSLFPVFWIASLSLKDPTTVGDGRLLPSKWST